MSELFTEAAICSISTAQTGSEQMAIDEALWRHCTLPTLRIYRWAEPEITFGYTMKWEEARLVAANRPTTRRCTGGGIVIHGSDLTVCLAIPGSNPLTRLPPIEVYAAIHRAMRRALPEGSALAENGAGGSECFASFSTHDVLLGGRKILGGALRRGRHGLLYQGSIQFQEIGNALHLPHAICGNIHPWETPSDWTQTVDALRDKRYASPEWNQKR